MEANFNRVPKWVWWGVAVPIAFQVYLFRELVAAEILFAIGFAILLMVIAAIYGIVVAADRGVTWIEANSQGVTLRAKHQWSRLEAISRKLSRRQHSESAP